MTEFHALVVYCMWDTLKRQNLCQQSACNRTERKYLSHFEFSSKTAWSSTRNWVNEM